eukprot:403361855
MLTQAPQFAQTLMMQNDCLFLEGRRSAIQSQNTNQDQIMLFNHQSSGSFQNIPLQNQYLLQNIKPKINKQKQQTQKPKVIHETPNLPQKHQIQTSPRQLEQEIYTFNKAQKVPLQYSPGIRSTISPSFDESINNQNFKVNNFSLLRNYEQNLLPDEDEKRVFQNQSEIRDEYRKDENIQIMRQGSRVTQSTSPYIDLKNSRINPSSGSPNQHQFHPMLIQSQASIQNPNNISQLDPSNYYQDKQDLGKETNKFQVQTILQPQSIQENEFSKYVQSQQQVLNQQQLQAHTPRSKSTSIHYKNNQTQNFKKPPVLLYQKLLQQLKHKQQKEEKNQDVVLNETKSKQFILQPMGKNTQLESTTQSPLNQSSFNQSQNGGNQIFTKYNQLYSMFKDQLQLKSKRYQQIRNNLHKSSVLQGSLGDKIIHHSISQKLIKKDESKSKLQQHNKSTHDENYRILDNFSIKRHRDSTPLEPNLKYFFNNLKQYGSGEGQIQSQENSTTFYQRALSQMNSQIYSKGGELISQQYPLLNSVIAYQQNKDLQNISFKERKKGAKSQLQKQAHVNHLHQTSLSKENSMKELLIKFNKMGLSPDQIQILQQLSQGDSSGIDKILDLEFMKYDKTGGKLDSKNSWQQVKPKEFVYSKLLNTSVHNQQNKN